ncbi:right-handed parallel beta-helix repeat-containing protein [Bacillus sp. USDA818B3_A]|uniref:right-handed parallel beta-helix repeat-containing protein n=1 Tax=Bacillus sp. USDA818B3_A TaxID=2698834 RepID=UPI00136E589B|nr:right-handed parallel beta-helix repeat-containing protein [Bacillus sp. USDA818B3_A]
MIIGSKKPFYTIIILGLLLLLNACKASQINNDKDESELSANKQLIEKDNEIPIIKNMYMLDLKRWGIHNDGTHPKETTKGINDALQWASEKEYTTFYIPEGTYLITKGKSVTDHDARINLVSNMTFLLDKKAIIQKEKNGFEIYSTLYLDSNAKNIKITGGTLRGDREAHDYSQKGRDTDGTHEWGNGITIAGASNVIIENIKIENFTGDGIEIGGSTIYGDYITEQDLELGGLNDKGEEITAKGKIRSNNYDVTNFKESIYSNPHYRNLMMWIPEGVEGTYDLFYFRKDGRFIKGEKDQRFNSTWGYSRIPKDADYFRVVFNANSIENVKVNRMTVAVTEDLTIQNCDIGYNRRQGITVGASDNIKILNNKIHHTEGTAPESGIDIEPGFYPAINTLIKGNQFLNNSIQMVFSYGGNATVEDNYFGPNVDDGMGFSINPAYYGATVRNNKFENTNFVTWGNTKFIKNSLVSSSASFEGGSGVIVDGINGVDSNLGFTQTENNGIKVSNIILKSSQNPTDTGGLAVYGEPIQLESITLKGNNEISGDGNSKNVYKGFTFINTPEMNLIPGEFTECSTNEGTFELGFPGKINFTKCKFKNTILYTYNSKTDVTIKNSSFENDKGFNGPSVLAMEAKNVNVLDNTFNVKTVEKDESPIIQIGRDASEQGKTKVYGATIKGNKLISNIKRIGIDSINGGMGAPAYLVENNKLYNTSLNLVSKDINLNNKIYKKLIKN